jgi:hypothetical protein
MRDGVSLGLLLTILGCVSESEQSDPPPPTAECAADDITLDDGSCLRAGVPPDGCGVGFAHDGDRGCDALLPETPCAPGWLAVPGDAECRQHPCGTAPWGDIAVDAATQYVDATYQVGDGDGTSAKPWPTIQEGVAAAQPGATIAIAAGSYQGDVEIVDRPVVLWGRCASMVEIVGVGAQPGAVMVRDGADGTVVRGVALTGVGRGLASSGSHDVVLDQAWVHDTVRGIELNDSVGSSSLIVRDSLIESVIGIGAFIAGTSAIFDGVVIRDVLVGDADQGAGRGVAVQLDPATGALASATLQRSLIRRTRNTGVRIGGATVTIESSVVADTQPESGVGIGVFVEADAMLMLPSNLTMLSSIVERCHDLGIGVEGSTANIEASVVRDIFPSAVTQEYGRGITVQYDEASLRSDIVIASSLIELTHEAGVVISGSDGAITATAVRDTRARVVDMLFGDGFIVAAGKSVSTIPASLVIDTSVVSASARAGMGAFGAPLTLSRSRLLCQAFDLAVGTYADSEGQLLDHGDNVCGCPTPSASCQAAATTLEPPGAVAIE